MKILKMERKRWVNCESCSSVKYHTTEELILCDLFVWKDRSPTSGVLKTGILLFAWEWKKGGGTRGKDDRKYPSDAAPPPPPLSSLFPPLLLFSIILTLLSLLLLPPSSSSWRIHSPSFLHLSLPPSFYCSTSSLFLSPSTSPSSSLSLSSP